MQDASRPDPVLATISQLFRKMYNPKELQGVLSSGFSGFTASDPSIFFASLRPVFSEDCLSPRVLPGCGQSYAKEASDPGGCRQLQSRSGDAWALGLGSMLSRWILLPSSLGRHLSLDCAGPLDRQFRESSSSTEADGLPSQKEQRQEGRLAGS